ncbi:MAG: LUD domain-containing protein [Verrucomicrobiae bacterium]|nr:LUD domain-containing protein [Verrucomicrobiae bacterium]
MALIGTGSELDRAIAVACAEAGADIALGTVDRSQEQDFGMNSIANELWAIGREHFVRVMDATEATEAASFADEAWDRLGRCDALVARTGSIALTAQSGFGRALSVLPPAHVVVARRAQLVAEIADALSRLASRYGRSWPSMLSFITGPSRTADIEKILVLGAHGPRELHLLFVNA